MTLKDAFIVSLIASFTVWILQFFAQAQWNTIVSDIAQWIFTAIQNYLVTFAGIFIALSGLDQIVKMSKEKEKSSDST